VFLPELDNSTLVHTLRGVIVGRTAVDERRERGARAACPFSFLRRDERARFFLVSPTLSPPCTARAPLGSPPQSHLCGFRTNLNRAAPGREGRQGLDAIGAARPLLQLSPSPELLPGHFTDPTPRFSLPPPPSFFPSRPATASQARSSPSSACGRPARPARAAAFPPPRFGRCPCWGASSTQTSCSEWGRSGGEERGTSEDEERPTTTTFFPALPRV